MIISFAKSLRNMDYNILSKKLQSKGRSLTQNKDDGKDLAQDAFCYAWEKLGEPTDEEEEKQFSIMCFAKLRSCYYDLLREAARNRKLALEVYENERTETL